MRKLRTVSAFWNFLKFNDISQRSKTDFALNAEMATKLKLSVNLLRTKSNQYFLMENSVNFKRKEQISAFSEFKKVNPTNNIGNFSIELFTTFQKCSIDTSSERRKPVDIRNYNFESRYGGLKEFFRISGLSGFRHQGKTFFQLLMLLFVRDSWRAIRWRYQHCSYRDKNFNTEIFQKYSQVFAFAIS